MRYILSKLVYGFGINDADYVVCPTIDGKQVWCTYYAKWQNMLLRQTPKEWKRKPTYTGVKVCEEWRSFMAFRAWMVTQDFVGKELDKDLLGDGKVYSPETCVFVTQAVNKFTTDSGAARGEWPIGVCKVGYRFRAQIRVNGKVTYLGLFDCPNEAHQTWRKAKQELGLKLIEQQVCIKAATGLWNYILKI
jgi:hypothetical protein